MSELTITLNAIREHNPCEDGWKKLLIHLEKTKADDEPLPIRTILKSNGLDDTLWCLRALPEKMDNAVRLLVCDLVEPAMAFVPDGETRPQVAIAAARAYARGEISSDDLYLAAAWDATRFEARTTVWYAAMSATRAATRSKTRTAVWYAARDATRAATRDAAWDPQSLVRVDQERIFVEWLDKMESADELE